MPVDMPSDAKSLLKTVCKTLHDGKAQNVVSLSTTAQSGGLFAHIVVATAGSRRHAAALSERLARAIKTSHRKKPVVEASKDSEWILLDGGDVIAHIMLAEARRHYDLEKLWGFYAEDKQ